jgi:hypothetical protein
MNCLPPPARQGLVHIMGNPGMPLQWMNILTWVLLGDIAPTGEVPPLAEAIVNGNLWTRYGWIATFLSLPSPDPNVQSYVASYFHIPYTPVTTATTTAAATTVTVTKTSNQHSTSDWKSNHSDSHCRSSRGNSVEKGIKFNLQLKSS